MKNIPNRIYLNVGENDLTSVDFSTLEGVSWSLHKESTDDIEYLRAHPQRIRHYIVDVNFIHDVLLEIGFDKSRPFPILHDNITFHQKAYIVVGTMIDYDKRIVIHYVDKPKS